MTVPQEAPFPPADPYPEHTKLGKVQHLTQAVVDFLDFCRERDGIVLGEYDQHARLHPIGVARRDALLAECFGIDMAVVEQEKRAMLGLMRARHQEGAP